jgi:hypothetical protein
LGDLISLNRAKKRAERKEAAGQAETNRARFGRTKSERAQDEHRTKRAKELLDQHRITGDAS